MIRLEVLGIIPREFQIDVEHNLWSIESVSNVSLGVLYKYILELVLRERFWNCTKCNSQFLPLSLGSR